MPRPLVAVVGRPNVGKSTLVNRFAGKRDAIVEEKPGVTRDRKFLDVDWAGRNFTVVDTGGWLHNAGDLATKVSEQAQSAVDDAALVIFVVDVVTGVTEEDERVARWVKRTNKPVLLLANKVDSDTRENDIWDFARLGLGDPVSVSALGGRRTGDVLDLVIEHLPVTEEDEVEVEEVKEPRIAIVGRPNVGKSTLFNRLVGEDRAVVHDMPGTTRDSIDTVVETPDGPLRFIDTAGMRRKARIDEGTEYYSMVRALKAIDDCDVVLLVIDATEGATNQDQRLAERIEVSGKPVILLLNKWEELDAEARLKATTDLSEMLSFVAYAPILKLSALTGKGVHKLLPAVWESLEAYRKRYPTAEVTKVIRAAQQSHPMAGLKIYYATQGAAEPPTFTLFSNKEIPDHYMRYLNRKLREHFELGPTPLKLRVRRRSA